MDEHVLNNMRGTGAIGNRETGTVTFHKNAIVKWNKAEIHLNNGGWYTPATKRRMCQVSEAYSLGFHVYQMSGEWWADYKGEAHKFVGRTLTLKREG